jgi:hypothetical protein
MVLPLKKSAAKINLFEAPWIDLPHSRRDNNPPQNKRSWKASGASFQMKGVVELAPNLQMIVGRGQVEKEGLPYLLALPPPGGRAFSFSVITRGGKDFFPSGYRGKTDKTRT